MYDTCSRYETNGTFETDILELYKEMEPLYKELHAYVRGKLSKVYGSVSSAKSGCVRRKL